MMKSYIKLIILTAICFASLGISANAYAEDAKEATGNYSGIYNGRQLFPTKIAIFCQIKAEDVVKDYNILYNCINKIARKINDANADTAAEGRRELSDMRMEELNILLSTAIAKSAAIANYEDVQTSMGDAGAKTQTEHDDNAAIVNTTSVLTDVINGMRELYAEKIKFEVLNNIESISPEVINDIALEKETADKPSDSSGSGASTSAEEDTTKVTTISETPFTSDWKYIRDNTCGRNVCTGKENTAEHKCEVQEATCPDGNYIDQNDSNAMYKCANGSCTKITASNTNDYAGEVVSTVYDKDGKCTVVRAGLGGNTSFTENCPDGEVSTSSGIKMYCLKGECTAAVPEVVITPEEQESLDNTTEEGGEDAYDYISGNKCRYNDETVTCPDNVVLVTENGTKVMCTNGICGAYIGDVEVTPNSVEWKN